MQVRLAVRLAGLQGWQIKVDDQGHRQHVNTCTLERSRNVLSIIHGAISTSRQQVGGDENSVLASSELLHDVIAFLGLHVSSMDDRDFVLRGLHALVDQLSLFSRLKVSNGEQGMIRTNTHLDENDALPIANVLVDGIQHGIAGFVTLALDVVLK